MDVPTETPDVIKNPEANPARQSVLSSKVITLNNPITIGDENIYFVYVQNNDDLPVPQDCNTSHGQRAPQNPCLNAKGN